MFRRTYTRGRGGLPMGRLLIAGIVILFSLISYFGSQSTNPVTQEVQHISISPQEEIAMGLQAAPELAQQFGGLDRSQEDQQRVKEVGYTVVSRSAARNTPYQFDFHLLADPATINAFALPGGQVFITRALYDRLISDGELAGVLGHEAAHVVARHSAEQIAKAQLTEGLTGAAVIAACDMSDPNQVCAGTAQMAALVGQLINMKYGRADELESDFLGVCFMSQAGYDPQEMAVVMQVLAEESAGSQPLEWLSTHPDPANRLELIQQHIDNRDQCPVQ